MNKRILLPLALAALSAGAALNAEEDSLALPKTNGAPNLTIEFGPSFSRNTSEVTARGLTSKVTGEGWGAGAAFGWRPAEYNKLSASIGLCSAYSEVDGLSEDDIGVTCGIAYDLYAPLAARNRCEGHIGATVGYGYQYTKIDGGGRIMSDSAVAPFYGIRVGATIHLNRKCYLDLTYSFCLTGDYKMTFAGTTIKGKVTGGNTFNLSIGLKL
jgi:hypothetical protein